jgi:8-oxo-dGTP pyrophosphatase MutT (NUDIX family)
LPRQKDQAHVQYGALPYARANDGTLRVMLITSRETRRWVIPKGWPMRNRSPQEAAALEAFEEAGLIGRVIRKRAIGRYRYDKFVTASRSRRVRVDVFLFEVAQQLDDWPEKDERETRWFRLRRAAGLVEEAGLAALLLKLGAIARTPKADLNS